MKKSCNFSVPGSGKTSSVLGVYAIYEFYNKVKRILVIGPKNCFETWIKEFEICFNGIKKIKPLTPDNFNNSDDFKNEIKYNYKLYNLICVNYERLESISDELSIIANDDTLLVFDEIHRIKKINGKYANASLKISKNSLYIVALTGTPIPNSYSDLYNILKIILGRNFNYIGFRDDMFMGTKFNQKYINDKFFPFFCRTSKYELEVPEANKDLVISVKSHDVENKIFKILYSKFKKNMFEFFIRILQLESNPNLLLKTIDKNDLINILDDWDDNDKVATNEFKDLSSDLYELVAKCPPSSKKLKLIEIVKKLISENKKVLVWCIFISNIFEIKNDLQDLGIKVEVIYGNTQASERKIIIDSFKKNLIDVLVTNPHTLAESVSLHDVCHDAIYFEYSYNLVHLLQSKDRIHRLGLPCGQYTQWWFLKSTYTINNFEFSLGEKIYDRLIEKEQIMIKAIDENNLESVTTKEEDLEIIFSDLRKNN